MIREAIEKITELATADVIEVAGKKFLVAKNGDSVREIIPNP